MNTKEIKQFIISSRNFLFNETMNDFIVDSFKNLENDFYLMDYCDVFLKDAIFTAIKYVNIEISKNNLKQAAFILNFIHNFPFEKSEIEKWNIDYFLSIEVPDFIENNHDEKYFKEIFLITMNCVYQQFNDLK